MSVSITANDNSLMYRKPSCCERGLQRSKKHFLNTCLGEFGCDHPQESPLYKQYSKSPDKLAEQSIDNELSRMPSIQVNQSVSQDEVVQNYMTLKQHAKEQEHRNFIKNDIKRIRHQRILENQLQVQKKQVDKKYGMLG